MAVTVHKKNQRPESPLVSLILLDWSCRESLHALSWLERQDVPREEYELLWVECYERVLPEAMASCDAVITCGQQGRYHKHCAYNVGLLNARGKVVVVCDSDAVFSHNFVASIISSFELESAGHSKSLVLMHYEYRTASTYPADLSELDQLGRYQWRDLWPNVGACMSVLREDAIRFGGFDEHASYRGYLCGPYDLGWRMMNAGIPECWHDPVAALWHFAHPEPTPFAGHTEFSLRRYLEIGYPHFENHAAAAVEALSTGRLLPLHESAAIWELRMAARHIDSKHEKLLARVAGRDGFTRLQRLKMYLGLVQYPLVVLARTLMGVCSPYAKSILGERRFQSLRRRWREIEERRKAKRIFNV